jgi:ribonucleoside-diphosphate reductase alpha chain
VRAADGQWVDFEIEDAAVQQFRHLHGDATPLPAHFAQAMNVSAEDQLRMASRVQMCVDNAVSKTVRLPQSASTHDLDLALLQAWELGLKGCAVYRSGSKNSVTRSFNSGPV